jgi:hypothetical protein
VGKGVAGSDVGETYQAVHHGQSSWVVEFEPGDAFYVENRKRRAWALCLKPPGTITLSRWRIGLLTSRLNAAQSNDSVYAS